MDAFCESCTLSKNLLNKNEFPINQEGIIKATVPDINNSKRRYVCETQQAFIYYNKE
jgi:hypothetical protein